MKQKKRQKKASRQARPAIDPRFCGYRVRVAKSPIQGWGVYAEEKIPAGKKVIEYTGERVPTKVANRRLSRVFRPGGNRRVLVFVLNRNWCIDAGVGGGGAELINHCCDPNLVTKKTRAHIYYYSRRRIGEGEELTVDYRFPPNAIRVECKCGAAKCRGTINMRPEDWAKGKGPTEKGPIEKGPTGRGPRRKGPREKGPREKGPSQRGRKARNGKSG